MIIQDLRMSIETLYDGLEKMLELSTIDASTDRERVLKNTAIDFMLSLPRYAAEMEYKNNHKCKEMLSSMRNELR